MLIDYANGQFLAIVTFEERHIPRHALWSWDADLRRWTTRDPLKAYPFAEGATPAAKRALDTWVAGTGNSLALSYATSASIDVPAPSGLAYDPYQLAGILYASQRADTLIGDKPGLGKTIQAIGLSNFSPTIKRVLVVPPAGGKVNWMREWEKWDCKGLTVGIARSKTKSEVVRDAAGNAVKDDKGKSKRRTWTEHDWPNTDVVVCNYEMLVTFSKQVRALTWDLLVCDEAQYLINKSILRSKQIFGCRANKKKNSESILPIAAKRRLFLSGTPMTTQPSDIWALCSECDPKGLGKNWKTFVYRYCEATSNGFGLDTSGASNLEELNDRLRTAFMVRRTKEAVLTQLPPKRRQLVPLPADGLSKFVEREETAAGRLRAALAEYEASIAPPVPEGATPEPEKPWRGLEIEMLERYGPLDSMSYIERAATLTKGEMLAFEEMSTVRMELAVAKIPMVVEHVTNALSTGEKIILFVVHKQVAELLKAAFPQCAYITGAVPGMKRQAEVDRFQNDPACNIAIGNITAMGTLYTMTASSWVIFAEMDWLPSSLEQAEDRAHRRGQTNSVLVQHLVVEGTMDARFVEVILQRQEILNQALDKPFFRPAA